MLNIMVYKLTTRFL